MTSEVVRWIRFAGGPREDMWRTRWEENLHRREAALEERRRHWKSSFWTWLKYPSALPLLPADDRLLEKSTGCMQISSLFRTQKANSIWSLKSNSRRITLLLYPSSDWDETSNYSNVATTLTDCKKSKGTETTDGIKRSRLRQVGRNPIYFKSIRKLKYPNWSRKLGNVWKKGIVFPSIKSTSRMFSWPSMSVKQESSRSCGMRSKHFSISHWRSRSKAGRLLTAWKKDKVF